METKKFKPFDKVIARFRGNNWICDLYSHYNTKTNAHITMGFGDLEDDCILPYEGNEHLVGTTDSPDEEISLEEGEWLMLSDYADCSPSDWQLRIYSTVGKKRFHVFCDSEFDNEKRISLVDWAFAIRFSDFNPSHMEETKKHILCVKNGKIVKYKG